MDYLLLTKDEELAIYKNELREAERTHAVRTAELLGEPAEPRAEVCRAEIAAAEIVVEKLAPVVAQKVEDAQPVQESSTEAEAESTGLLDRVKGIFS